MRLELSPREKNLIFILALLIITALAYTFFFNGALEKWVAQRGVYQQTQELVVAMEQSSAELEVHKQYVEQLREEAQALSEGYHLDYTNHRAEQKITALLMEKGLVTPYVDVAGVIREPFPAYGLSGEETPAVQASRIPLRFSVSGSMNQMIDLLDTIQKDTGVHISDFTMFGADNGEVGMAVTIELLLGDTEGVLDE